MRIRAARTARQHPKIFAALADGRLHLSAVVLLAPHLTRENASDLLAAAAGKTKAGLETLLAQRFPRLDVPADLVPLVPAHAGPLVPERVADAGPLAPGQVATPAIDPAPAPLQAFAMPLAPAPVGALPGQPGRAAGP